MTGKLRLVWATDVHWDHVDANVSLAARRFGESMRERLEPDAVVLTGDLANGHHHEAVVAFQRGVSCHVAFLWGNHDAYGSSFAKTRAMGVEIEGLSKLDGRDYRPEMPKYRADVRRFLPDRSLSYLRAGVEVRLSESVALVGSDGWYDVRFGDPDSPMVIGDFTLIEENRKFFLDAVDGMREAAKAIGKVEVVRKRKRVRVADAIVQSLLGMSDEGLEALDPKTRRLGLRKQWNDLARSRANAFAHEIDTVLLATLADPCVKKVYVATHVPPFAGAAWHRGALSDAEALPYFSSKVMGEAIAWLARERPSISFEVLCGHTHSPGLYEALPNLLVRTGTSGPPDHLGLTKLDYGHPRESGVFEIEVSS